jgi:uncharacterized membrane protein
MNIDEFNEWIEGLDLQTLTDELKEEIITKVRELYEDAQVEGYTEAKDNMILFIENDM